MASAKPVSPLFDEYLPFRLYAEHQQGASFAQLAQKCNRPESWVEERYEAARLCIENQIRFDYRQTAA